MDPRVVEHAKWLVNYCTSVKRGDNVLIRLGGAQSGEDEGLELATEVYKEASRQGANAFFPRWKNGAKGREIRLGVVAKVFLDS
jgi:leucyl aminopeptidase (aminopeptidase T)